MGQLILLRHGESIWNQENRFTGSVDIDLSQNGIQEAMNVGEQLKKYNISHVFCSLLKRSKHTAELVLRSAHKSNYLFFENAALNERNYGKLQGLNKLDAFERYGTKQVQFWRRGYNAKPPDGESLKETSTRVISYYNKFIQPLTLFENIILIVAHGNSLRVLIKELEKKNNAEVAQLEIPNCVPIIYKFKN